MIDDDPVVGGHLHVEFQIFNAKGSGVPKRRHRVFRTEQRTAAMRDDRDRGPVPCRIRRRRVLCKGADGQERQGGGDSRRQRAAGMV